MCWAESGCVLAFTCIAGISTPLLSSRGRLRVNEGSASSIESRGGGGDTDALIVVSTAADSINS